MEIRIRNPEVGDHLRDFALPDSAGNTVKLGDMIGKPLVLIFYSTEKIPASHQTLLAFRDAYAEFQSRGARVAAIGITPSQEQKDFVAQNQIPFPMLHDEQFKISMLHGAVTPRDSRNKEAENFEMNAVRRTLLIGSDMRIMRIYDAPDPASHARHVLDDIDKLILLEPPRQMQRHAPVLLIPNVLPPDLCQRLMQVWHEQGNEDSGFMKQMDGKTVGIYDYSHKIRRDHFMKESPELAAVKKHIANRVIPTILQAYNYEVTRFEDFRIACYDSSRGGYFRPHRDNTTAGTAHRRFAMSLLLNDDYQGGSLRFPEYGLHEYRPGAGSAIIFSCSLLHEATDVTAGIRFVLLSFFYGEKEAKIREDYAKRRGEITGRDANNE